MSKRLERVRLACIRNREHWQRQQVAALFVDDAGVYRMANFFSEATRRVTQLMGQVEYHAANGHTLRH